MEKLQKHQKVYRDTPDKNTLQPRKTQHTQVNECGLVQLLCLLQILHELTGHRDAVDGTEGTVASSPTRGEQAPAQGRKLLSFNKIVKQNKRSGHCWWKYFKRVVLRAWGYFVLAYSHIARGECSSLQVPQATRQKNTDLVPQFSETFKQDFFDNLPSSKSLSSPTKI